MKYTKEHLSDNKIAIKFLSNENYNFLNRFYQIGINLTMNQAIICYEKDGTWSWDDDINAFEGYTIIDSEVLIAEIKKLDNRKIKGYKAPMDMFKGRDGFFVRKGDLYVKRDDPSNNYRLERDLDEALFAIPSEIAESWEPVYEEENKPVFKHIPHIISYFKGCNVICCVGEYILVSNDTNPEPKYIIRHYISKENGFLFDDTFSEELKELGIKF
jgi:hypothetical protein